MKLPLSFSLNSLLQMLLPGFIISTSFFPWIYWILNELSFSRAIEYGFFASVIFFGWLLIICDMHIYMLYEGRRYWPQKMKHFFINKEKSRLAKYEERLKDARIKLINGVSSASETVDVTNIYLESSVDKRQFPIDEKTGKRFSRYPTRLGNLLLMYETYPKVMYGMDGVFFWYRLWLLLPKDVKDEYESQQSRVDSTVYASFAFYISGIIALLSALLSAVLQAFGTNIILNVPLCVFIMYSILAFCMGYMIYRLSLHLHSQFGETWKSLFDVYRTKLNDLKFDDDISFWTGGEDLFAGKTTREKNEIIWSYLQYFTIRCPRTGETMTPPQYLEKRSRVAGDEGEHRNDFVSNPGQENQ